MTEVILVKTVQTCRACPSQWNAWDLDGNYWYLRYRHGHGTAERQPGPDVDTWAWKENGDISFTNEGTDLEDGEISLEDFCRMARPESCSRCVMKAAIWARVSGDTQNASNQLYELRQWAQARGLEIAAEFVTEDSAWTKKNGNGMKGAEFDVRRNDMLEGARLGKYEVVLCWGLDRLSRRGAEDMLSYVRRLTDTGCRLWSLKDPWAESTADPMTRELLFSVFATIARFESERRSERIKAGIERRRREGKPIGGATTRKGHGKGSRHSGERKSAAWTDAERWWRNKERAEAGGGLSEKREKQ